MNQKLDQIRHLYNKLDSLRLNDRCYYDFRSSVEKMLELIKELDEEKTDAPRKADLPRTYSRLARTLGKEVTYINYHQERMNKKNAAKIRRREYDKSIEDAISQIHADVIHILNGHVAIN